MTIIRKAVLATALAASALTSISPAMARGYGGWGGHGYRHHRHHGGGDDAAIAIGAGIIGLAIGAMIASGAKDRDRPRYRGGEYDSQHDNGQYNDEYYRDGWQYRDGYYYDRQGKRHDREDWRRDHGDRYDDRRSDDGSRDDGGRDRSDDDWRRED